MGPRNLKLLLVAYHFPPANNGGVQRPLQMLKYLPRHGVDVSVLTHGYERTNLRGESTVLRVYDTSRRGAGALLHLPMRALQRLSRVLGSGTSWHGSWARGVKRRADAIMRIAKPDVLLATYPPIETLDIGLYLADKYGIPLVADFRDGLLFEPIEAEMLRSTRTRKRYRKAEERIAQQAAGIITVSDPISDYFKTEYQHEAVVTIPNGFDPAEEGVEPTPNELDPGKFNVVYTGRLGLSDRGRHAWAFVEAVTRLIKESPEAAGKLRIHFIGDFSSEERRALAELVQLGIVRIHGFVDRPRAIGFQRAATLLLLLAATARTSVATGKLFEYLNTGRPILALTKNTVAEKIIIRTKTGIVADPNDADAIYRILRRLLLDPGFVDLPDRNVSEIAQYSRLHQMGILASFLRGLLAGGLRADNT